MLACVDKDLSPRLKELEKKSIDRLLYARDMCRKIFNTKLVLCYSGGKDSDVILYIAQKCLKNDDYVVEYSQTGMDHPTVVYEIRETFKRLRSNGMECRVWRSGKNLFSLIKEKGVVPTRILRYCCAELKENGSNDFIVTGVRWAESPARTKRKDAEVIQKNSDYKKSATKKEIILNGDNDEKRMIFEDCMLKAQRVVNPIVDWSDDDVREYIMKNDIHISEMYKYYKRVGCIMCPFSGAKKQQFDACIYKKFAENIKKACIDAYKKRIEKGMFLQFESGEDMYKYFLGDIVKRRKKSKEIHD